MTNHKTTTEGRKKGKALPILVTVQLLIAVFAVAVMVTVGLKIRPLVEKKVQLEEEIDELHKGIEELDKEIEEKKGELAGVNQEREDLNTIVAKQLSRIAKLDKRSFTPLPPPSPEYPASDSTIKMPRADYYFLFRWTAVEGASYYNVEVDCFGCGRATNNWYSVSTGSPWHIRRGLGLRSPIYSSKVHRDYRDSGGRGLRWRVWAVDSEGREGKKSDWCEFSFDGAPEPGRAGER